MKGFFSAPVIETKRSSHLLRRQGCVVCGLHRHTLSPKMGAYGKGKADILNVGEAPGEVEDKKGRQWQGKAGRMLRRAYKDLGMGLFRDCTNINAINCRPTNKRGSNRMPTKQEVTACRRKVFHVIEECKPRVIILLGGVALQSFLGHRWQKDLGGITKWRGWTVPDRDYNAWVCPTFHPSFVERQEESGVVEHIWKQDLERAFALTNQPLPTYTDERKQVKIVEDRGDVQRLLRRFIKRPASHLLSIDIETTSLKPYGTDQKIVCIALCDRPNRAYVIPAPTKGTLEYSQLPLVLTTYETGKVGANIKFEDTWMNTKYNSNVSPWVWDTMQAAHVLDNRAGITSLKFQVYIHFGVLAYEANVSQYLKSSNPKDANSSNRVMELMEDKVGRTQLMTYCGLDALYTYRLALKQMGQMGVRMRIRKHDGYGYHT